MILGGQIALLLIGICVVVVGRFPLSRGKTVKGAKARLLGIMCLLPIPLALSVGFAIGFFCELIFQTQPTPHVYFAVDFIVFITYTLTLMYLAEQYANKQSNIA